MTRRREQVIAMGGGENFEMLVLSGGEETEPREFGEVSQKGHGVGTGPLGCREGRH